MSLSVNRKDFAVCLKPLQYPYQDRSWRLLEWIELLQQMGVDKIILYHLGLHENMTRLLEHYSSLGIVEVVPTSLPGYYTNEKALQHLLLKFRYYYHVMMDEMVR